MLAKAYRVRAADDFRRIVREGVKVGRPSVVLHMVRTQNPPSRAGFVVSKAIGNAVTRNRIKRRLRHLAAERLRQSAFPVEVVVRALPVAAADLTSDFGGAWEASVERLAP